MEIKNARRTFTSSNNKNTNTMGTMDIMRTNGIRASILVKGEFRRQLEDKSGYFSKLQWNLRILWEGFGNSKEKVRKTVLKINASKEVKAEMLRYCCKQGNNGIIFNGRYGHFSCLVKGKKTTGIAFIPYNAEYRSEWSIFYTA